MDFHDETYLPATSMGGIVNLAKSIKKVGQIYPILTWGGKIIDGRARYLACRLIGVEPVCQDVSHMKPDEVHLETNMKRRNSRINDWNECDDLTWWGCFECEADEPPEMLELIKRYAGETSSPRLCEVILHLMDELASRAY